MRWEEKLLNDETICSVKLLAHTSTNSKTSSMATSSVAKRETAISCDTPIFFFHDPSPFPNYKHALIYQCESTKRYKEKLTHTTLKYTSAVKPTGTQPKKVCMRYRTQIYWSFKRNQNKSFMHDMCISGIWQFCPASEY